MTIFLKNTHNLLSINKAINLGYKTADLGVSVVPELIIFHAHNSAAELCNLSSLLWLRFHQFTTQISV